MEKVAGKCYIPANQTMLEQIDLYKNDTKKFKISYSISGIFLDQQITTIFDDPIEWSEQILLPH